MDAREGQDASRPEGGALPLRGLKVVDFSTLLPGPFATLMLAEAGADVVKIERPGKGDEMRGYEPRVGPDGAIFALLNRGKASVALDLKSPDGLAQAKELARGADILVEQFRPGVMARLGLSYEALSAENPRLIYCSITGYGQDGPKAHIAAHDMNYGADAGLLSLVSDSDGTPSLLPIPLADIGGGTYPAIINILMAVIERSRTGRGRHLDISMTDNLFPFLYWALAGAAAGQWPSPNGELITGGSPRYAIYRTADGRHLAAAPLEDQFWRTFCAVLGLNENASKADVATAVAARPSGDLMAAFAGKDACVSLVASIEEAMADPHVAARDLFRRRIASKAGTIAALPLPLVEAYRDPEETKPFPDLG